MQPGALIHLSRKVKIVLLCTLLLGVISSICLVAYGLVKGADGERYFSSGCGGQVISDSLIGFFDVDSRSKALGDKLPSFECSLMLL